MQCPYDHAARKPPSPAAPPLIGHTFQFAADPLGFPLRCARSHGAAVRLSVRGLEAYFLTDPSAVAEVFAAHKRFTVDALSRGLSDALGSSLLVSEGASWERQRRLVQPAFHKNRLREYAGLIRQSASGLIAQWQPGQTIDLHAQMSRLMCDIICKVVLGREAEREAGAIASFLDIGMRYVLGIAKTGLRAPWWMPTPGNLACRRAMKRVDTLIYALIRARRAAPGGDDLLSLLLQARDDGDQLTDKQVRDEVVTMLLVGHETSALALTFACWLLGRHPTVWERLRLEVDEALAGRAATADDLDRLPYAGWIFKETLRLYPPVWALGREAKQACDVGGYAIAAGTQVLLSPWVSHRLPAHFADPDVFRPERWGDGASPARGAYFPFGGGARACLGQRLATMEVVLVLATLAQRCDLVVAPDDQLELVPSVTLRPKRQVRLTVYPR
jgi:cytochrome P450